MRFSYSVLKNEDTANIIDTANGHEGKSHLAHPVCAVPCFGGHHHPEEVKCPLVDP